jgi:hypothetical protein
LLAAQEDPVEVEMLCTELKQRRPRQRIALLVGAPGYVREIGGERKGVGHADRDSTPRSMIGPTRLQLTQWHAMMERLLAAR